MVNRRVFQSINKCQKDMDAIRQHIPQGTTSRQELQKQRTAKHQVADKAKRALDFINKPVEREYIT